MNLRDYVRDIPDYPKEGIVFFDITPDSQRPGCFQAYCGLSGRKIQELRRNQDCRSRSSRFYFRRASRI